MATAVLDDWAAEAVGSADFGDVRRRQRVLSLLTALAAQPGGTISATYAGDWASTIAAYRLLDNPHLDPTDLVASVGAATIARTADEAVMLWVQDTTEIHPTSPQRCQGLGRLANAEATGLWLHSLLAVTVDGIACGLVHQQIWIRPLAAPPSRAQRYQIPIEGKESAKWLRGLVAAAHVAPAQQQVIVVADREADIYELYSLLHQLGRDFVIRVAQDRCIASAPGRLWAAIQAAPPLGAFPVSVPRSSGRPARLATLTLRAARVTLKPPDYHGYTSARRQWWADHPEVPPLLELPLLPLDLAIVEVLEEEPPEGTSPLHWRLLTSLPTDRLDQARLVVEYYTRRWVCERFHYVLKQGCAVERLQLETAERWERALVLYSLVAWHLLWLTQLGRALPEMRVDLLVDPPVWQALGARLTGAVPRSPPTLAEFVQQVGRLGGHLGRRRDGPPGVKTLWRGWSRLRDLVALWVVLHPSSTPLRSV